MRFRTLLVVVVGLLLGLAALERWGEAAEGSAPTWLTTPDTIPPERILWEGIPVPPEQVQRWEAEREAKRLKAARREAQLRVVDEWAKRTKAAPSEIKARQRQLRDAWAMEDIAEGERPAS